MKLDVALGLAQLRLAVAQINRARLQRHLYRVLDQIVRFGGSLDVPFQLDELWLRAIRAEDEFMEASRAYGRAKRAQFVVA